MADRMATGPRQASDRTVLSVAEVAQRLGVTPDAVRARLHRGTLPGEKVAGEWRVFLPQEDEAVGRQDATGPQQDTDRTGDAPLVEQLRSENAYLRDQLATTIVQLGAERERADVLMREALGRIEALGAGEASSPATTSPAPPPAPDPAPARPWWRRLLGGD